MEAGVSREKLPFTVRHPYIGTGLSALGGELAGGAGGALLGLGAGALAGQPLTGLQIGLLGGEAAGALGGVSWPQHRAGQVQAQLNAKKKGIEKKSWSPFGSAPQTGEEYYQHALQGMSPGARSAMDQNPLRITDLENSMAGAIRANPGLRPGLWDTAAQDAAGRWRVNDMSNIRSDVADINADAGTSLAARAMGARQYVNTVMSQGTPQAHQVALQFLNGLQQNDPELYASLHSAGGVQQGALAHQTPRTRPAYRVQDSAAPLHNPADQYGTAALNRPAQNVSPVPSPVSPAAPPAPGPAGTGGTLFYGPAPAMRTGMGPSSSPSRFPSAGTTLFGGHGTSPQPRAGANPGITTSRFGVPIHSRMS